jgi:hypothetical protein
MVGTPPRSFFVGRGARRFWVRVGFSAARCALLGAEGLLYMPESAEAVDVFYTYCSFLCFEKHKIAISY